MFLLRDGLIAALAALGLVTLLSLLLSALLRPRAAEALNAFAVVPCRGDGAELEQTVRALERAACGCGGFRRILILDRGMDAAARARAALLCRESLNVSLCAPSELPNL